MLDKDHVLISEAVYLGVAPVIFTSNLQLLISGAVGISIGSQVPDIDTTSSKIGQYTKPLSTLIARFGHRGITHSLLGLGAFIFLISFLLRGEWLDGMYRLLASDWPMFLDCLIIGYALHLIEDWFSWSGVIWLFPSHVEHYRRWYPPKLKPNGHQYYSPRYLKRIEPPIYVRTGIAKWFRYHSTDRGRKGRYERVLRRIAIAMIIIEIVYIITQK